MKTLLKMTIVTIVFVTIFLYGDVEVNAQSISEKCNYQPKGKENPSYRTMNCLLTETALKYNVPPEIVKAIAEAESGGWKHFENGNVIVTPDNGIGVMQITNKAGYDEDRLKNDIVYNIEAGVEILDRMFKRGDLPTIKRGERDFLESWYFAVMAYNGIKPVNSPIVQRTGARNTNAYQEKVYKIMTDHFVQIEQLPFSSKDFDYDSSSSENIKFVTKHYDFKFLLTKTKHLFTTGQKIATTTSVQLRPEPTTSRGTKGTLAKGEILSIAGPFVYDLDSKTNHFVWYPVKRANGTTGYVASSYLTHKYFKDVSANHYGVDEIYYLVDKGIINGVNNENFGLGQNLTRWQAVLMISRANKTSLENRPDPGFKDVPKTHTYYKEIAAAVDEGLFQGKSKTTFDPNATLTRAEMAVVLQRLYKFPAATKQHKFTDIKADWYADEVARLYTSGITNGVTPTTYGPSSTVKREDFSIFMTRSMNDRYRLKVE